MHKNGWRPFWAALGAALLVLLPLVGGTVLLTRQMVRTRIQTAQPQSGVPIQLPRAEHRMTLLLCTAGEQPGFLLVYLNAAQNSLNLLAVPGELTVPFNEETAGLAHCYGAAGPARCRQALLEVLGLPEDMLYLALSPAVLEKTASRYGPVRVGFSGALTADELTRTGLSAAVQSISAKEAHALLSGWDADGTLPPARRGAAPGGARFFFGITPPRSAHTGSILWQKGSFVWTSRCFVFSVSRRRAAPPAPAQRGCAASRPRQPPHRTGSPGRSSRLPGSSSRRGAARPRNSPGC